MVVQCNNEDQIHRDNDEPAIIRNDGTLEYYQYGNKYRKYDRPSVINIFDDNFKIYTNNKGEKHRDVGTSEIQNNGTQLKFYTNGELRNEVNLSKEDFRKIGV